MKLTPDQQARHDAITVPPCPPSRDDEHEAEAKRHLTAGDRKAALIAATYITNPARQKQMFRLLGME